MRKYNPNPKHEAPGALGRKGTRLDLSPIEASLLLNDPLHCVEVPEKRQLVGVKNGKIYVFQGNEADGYHAYPVTGNEVYTKYPAVARRIADLLGTDIQRLSRMRE
jgi:filamentous hemagglutinin